MSGVHTKAEVDRAVAATWERHEEAKKDPRVELPSPGMTGVFGPVGSGKTLLAVCIIKPWFEKGLNVFYGSAAGLRFGKEADMATEDGLETFYGFAKGIRHSIIFIDELQSYLSRFSQNAISYQLFEESLASLRKNGNHVVYTAQHDRHAGVAVRDATGNALWPSRMTHVPYKRRWHRRTHWWARPGKHDFCKLGVWELRGRNALSFTDPAPRLFLAAGFATKKPKARLLLPDYKSLVEASKTYETLASLDFAARLAATASRARKMVGA